MLNNIKNGGPDSRYTDLIAIFALVVLAISAWTYLNHSFTVAPTSTAGIIPDQTVRW